MKEKIKIFFKKIWDYILYIVHNPKTTLPAVIIAEAVFWFPVWFSVVLGFLINPWWFGAAGAVIAFWAGPFTPAVPLQLAFIALIERTITNMKKENKKDE